ncbi:glycosyltransferase [Methylobacterium sp. ID0610]|uniref:glycosyltransferase n=1 Tax=Methylobacterium carpenticola TaxID=3344827 RepID=UPI003683C4B6
MDLDPAAKARDLLLDPADATALQYLALAAREKGDGLRAIRLFARAHRLHGNREILLRQIDSALHLALNEAVGLINGGAIDRALDLLTRIAGIAPVEGDLASLLATVRLIRGEDAEAARLRALLPPEAGGLGVAVDGLAARAREEAYLGTVVIPAFRAEDTIGRALDSVAGAVARLRAATGRAEARVHICVVDDASPDGTAGAVLGWARANPDQSLALTVLSRNGGAGAARNLGAAGAKGDVLWFLDADDTFLADHLLVTLAVLDDRPDAGFVRTGIVFDAIDAEIAPAWREASEQTYPCNIAVRRACHLATGGFPDEPPFRPAVADDVGYSRVLHALVPGLRVPARTVRYTLRPGNAFDRQRAEMTGARPPGAGAAPDARFHAIGLLIRRRLHALERGRARAGGAARAAPPAPGTADALLGRLLDAPAGARPGIEELADLWLGRGEAARAEALLRAAVPLGTDDGRLGRALARTLAAQGRPAAASLRHALVREPADAATWFALGLDAYRSQEAGDALRAFRRTASLAPDAAAAVSNIGGLLMESGDAAGTRRATRRALLLQPDLATGLLHLGRAEARLGAPERAEPWLARADRLAPGRPDIALARAEIRLSGGDAAAAASRARRVLLLDPASYEAHALRARVHEATAQPEAALAAWDRAARCNPAYGEAFTRRAMLRLSARWGAPPVPVRPGAPGRRLAVGRLGLDGRFGNQILQYGFPRLYAERHGLVLETPSWLGQHLFDRDDPPLGTTLPRRAGDAAALAADRDGAYAGQDVAGYFCGDPGGWAGERDRFRALFAPGRNLRPLAEAIGRRLSGGTLVAIHLRRGDYGWGRFWIAPEAWYRRWLDALWPALDRPVLYIATDAPGLAQQAFAAYRPLTARDLPAGPAGAAFFPDFHALCLADRLATSNSTFSGTAALLNRRAACWRPDRNLGGLVAYDPWHSPILL